MRLVLGKTLEGRLGKPADLDRADRVGREAVAPRRGHAQKIAGQGKSHDLPAAVGKEFVEAHHPLDQIVERGGYLLFREYRLARREMRMPAEMFELPHLCRVERGADAERTHRAIGAGLPIRLDRSQESLHLHLRWLTGGRPNRGTIARSPISPTTS